MAKIDFGKYLTSKTIVNLSVFLGFLIFVGLIISFLGREISDKATEIRGHRSEIEGRITSIARLAELRATAKDAEPALLELRSLLPKRDELVAFPRYVESLAASHSLDARFEFRGDDTPPSEGVAGSSSFYISAVGQYRDIFTFVEAFEEGRFIVTINSFDVVIQRESAAFKADLHGLVYFRD
jgi:Tfp pilus assembly protein PilO